MLSDTQKSHTASVNVKVGFVVDRYSSLLKTRTWCCDSQWITRLCFHSDNIRTLRNLSAGKADDDAVHTGHCWHVDTVVRQITIVVENYLALFKWMHKQGVKTFCKNLQKFIILFQQYNNSIKQHLFKCRARTDINKKAVLSQRWPRNAPYGALKIFRTPWLRPRLLFPTFFMGFCSDPPYECSFKIYNP